MCKTPSIFGAGQPPDHSIAKARMLNVRYSLRALRQIRFAHLPQRPHLRCDFARPERKEECEKYTKIIFTTPSPQMLWLRQVRKERGVRKIHKDHFYNALTSDVVASPGQKGKRSAKNTQRSFLQRPHLRCCGFARSERKEECEKYTKIIFTTPSPQMLWLRQARKERGVRKIHKDHFYNALTSDVVASPGQKGKRSAKMRAAHFRTPLSFLASAAGARKRHIDGELTHTISWMNKP